MKKLLLISALVLTLGLFPRIAFGTYTAIWTATSTTQGDIYPATFNGVPQRVSAQNFYATSTSATSTFLGTVDNQGQTILEGDTYLNIDGGRQYLPDFDAAISKIITSSSPAPAVIAFIGDSHTTATPGFVTPITSYLQGVYGNAGYGYVNANTTQTLTIAGVTQVTAGTWTDIGANSAPAIYGASMTFSTSTDTATPATKTFTSKFTSAVIHYILQPNGGSFSWAIDGAGTTTVNTTAASVSMATTTISGLSDASHILTITITVAGTAGVDLAGVDFKYQNQGAYGVEVDNLGLSGTQSTMWTQTQTPAIWQQALANLAPNLVVINLGVNDDNQNIPLATYYSQMNTLINNVKTAMPFASIVLMSPPDIGTVTTLPMSAYNQQLKYLAASQKVAFIDNYKLIGPFAGANERGLYNADKLHLLTAGYNIVANHFVQFITQGTSISQASLGYQGPGYNFSIGQVQASGRTVPFGALTSGLQNTAIGPGSMNDLTTGSNNTAGGFQDMYQITTGGNNSSWGYRACNNLTSGSSNTCIGFQAGQGTFPNTGANNTSAGKACLQSVLSATNDSCVGVQGLLFDTTGSSNVAFGTNALEDVVSGGQNTSVGVNSGTTLLTTTNSNDCFFGFGADVTVDASTTLSDSCAIGENSKVTQNNSLILGGTGSNAVKVGIGTSSPTALLTVTSGNLTAGGVIPFLIASSTAGTATSTLIEIDANGAEYHGGRVWTAATSTGIGSAFGSILLSGNATDFTATLQTGATPTANAIIATFTAPTGSNCPIHWMPQFSPVSKLAAQLGVASSTFATSTTATTMVWTSGDVALPASNNTITFNFHTACHTGN